MIWQICLEGVQKTHMHAHRRAADSENIAEVKACCNKSEYICAVVQLKQVSPYENIDASNYINLLCECGFYEFVQILFFPSFPCLVLKTKKQSRDDAEEQMSKTITVMEV